MGSARAKRFGANSGSHCGSISGGAKRLEPRFGGMGFFEGFGGVLMEFWVIFGEFFGDPIVLGRCLLYDWNPFFGKKNWHS